ncbi:MAG TPA: fumarylacetoacetase [Candidatus Dormibacteraeota bacterium]|nr:fumarylacetoacetase [Candidatus Dormibacteraeota bacterium]
MNEFPIENLPYGAFERDGSVHLGVAIGDRIFDLHAGAEAALFDGVCAPGVLRAPSLNPLLAEGPGAWHALRKRLQALLQDDLDAELYVERIGAAMRLPVEVGDYVDFYSSEQHARNLGRIFRPNAEPLLPNWKWMPVGYHGRAGSIVVDATPVRRPNGQRKPQDADAPVFGPSTMLDIELEVGFVTGSESIFGLVLVNDWSARDIQAWEYQPLGPFLGKSFATTISPWVVTLDALAPFRIAPQKQSPAPLPYLRLENDCAYDIDLAADLQSAAMRTAGLAPLTIARTNAGELYWTMAQQLAHVRSNGTRIRPGDLFASGTISGSDPASYGSLIELTWRGTKPLSLPSGEQRAFLEDGDEVTLRGWCERDGLRVGFGACRGRIVAC